MKKFEGKFCPLIKDEYKECYCTRLTSQNIMAAIYYCSKHYEKCDIYNKIKKIVFVGKNGSENV